MLKIHKINLSKEPNLQRIAGDPKHNMFAFAANGEAIEQLRGLIEQYDNRRLLRAKNNEAAPEEYMMLTPAYVDALGVKHSIAMKVLGD